MNKLRLLQHICWLAAILFTLATACRPETSPESEPGESGVPVSQAALDRSKWVLVAYGSDNKPLEPVEGSVVTAAFDNGNEMHGVAGCNNYFTRYEINERAFSASTIEYTEMFCLEAGVMEQEGAFLAALAAAESIHRTGETLVISYEGGRLRFTPEPTPVPSLLTGTAWQLEALVQSAGDSVSALLVPEEIEITAEFETGQMMGQTGCNNYGFRYQIEGNRLTLPEGEVTAAGCVDELHTRLEAQFMAGMQSAETYEMKGDQLTIFFPGGELIFRAR